MSVLAELEGLDQVRFEIVSFPDPPDCRFGKPLGIGHAAGAPMRRVRRRPMQSRLHDGFDLCRRNAHLPTRPGRVLFQPLLAQCEEALPPKLDGRPGDAELRSDVLTGRPPGSHDHDFRAKHLPVRHRDLLPKNYEALKRGQQVAALN